MTTASRSPIAVVGLAALFPGSVDKDGFWRDIVAGKDLITDVPASHWLIEDYYDADPKARDKTYAKRGAFLPEVDFDAIAWGVPPSIVPGTDTTQLLALIVAQQVLEDALGTKWKSMPRDRVSVILGVTSSQELLGTMVSRLQRPVWQKALREVGLPESQVQEACEQIANQYVEWQESTFPGVLGNVVAGRIANRLDLGGTNCVTDAACASSFSALAMAVAELRLGESDLVITGGADTMNDIFMYVCFSKTPALSATGDCRPFSDRADGTMLGEGIGMVALKRLEDAERDGDTIYAVIAGVGSSSDGRSKSVYAPVAEGQAKALRRAYAQAGYSPSTVGLVEAHGTGTRAGDAAEFEGLRMVFAESGRTDRGWCALGSVKSQVGHTKAASGAAGLFKVVMALHHGVLPPTIKVDRPDPKLSIDESPFHLNTTARPWIRGAHPRRASVSSFGFGGSNFHVTLQEYEGRKPPRTRPMAGELILVGGATPADVVATCKRITNTLPGMLAWLARSTQESFDARSHVRLAIFAETEQDLVDKLAQAVPLVERGEAFSVPGGIELGVGPIDGQLAFLFPGQGSQYLGMGADVTMALPIAQHAWDRIAQVALDAMPLADVLFPRPAFDEDGKKAQATRLTATEWAQPALAATSLALLDVLRALDVKPSVVAGHSFGELTALHAAGALDEASLLRAARRRGELMAEAARVPGAMTSVTATVDELPPLGDIVIANHNTPRQLVLSGAMEAIESLERVLTERAITFSRLDVATAFHSPIVSPAVAPLRAHLAGLAIARPTIDVYANTTAQPYATEPDAIRDQLAAQLAAPVRFVEQIEAMYARGVRTFVEVGPGRVLTSLVGHILKKRPHRAIALDRKGRNGFASLQQALGSLSVAGVPVRYETLWADFARTDDPRTTTAPKMTMKLSGANHGKLYPPPGGASALPPPNPEVVEKPAATIPPAPTHSDAWVVAFQETQRQTAETHAAYQRATADAHAAFLRSADASLATLAGLAGQPMRAPQIAAPKVAPVLTTPTVMRAPVIAAPVIAAAVIAPPVVAPKPSVDLASLEALMLGIVADKTGYPSEMLGLDLDLEADLGVDSIKRVEILSATTERAPGLPKLNAAKLATLRTLRQIVSHLREQVGDTPVAAKPDVASLSTLMLGIVAEKTGYPPEMLGLDLDLEADLGVDSIKRVEILSATTERAPGLPKLNAAKLSTLRTLRQIVGYLEGELGGSVEAKPIVEAPVVEAAPIVRHALRAVPTPAVGLGTPGIATAKRLVVVGGADVGAAIAARLGATAVDRAPGDADAIVLLGEDPLTTFASARAIAPRFSEHGGTLVTVQDTGGDFGLAGTERAWDASPSALARTAALEWPKATVRALDVERGNRSADDVADAIVAELLRGGLERDVGLAADGTRVTLQTVEEGVSTRAASIHERSVVVASGGGRGVTAACLVELAKARCRFVLLGRTTLSLDAYPDVPTASLRAAILDEAKRAGEQLAPIELGRRADLVAASREVEQTMTAIRAAGGEARYVAVDVADEAALKVALDDVRSTWGPITSLVHGAGVLADKLIADKTDAQFTRVYDTKVRGLRALLAATANDPLEAIVLFSSVAARGNVGQADYAMANGVLNKVAAWEQRRRGASCLVRAIGWGPWDGGMVDDGLRARFASMGVSLIGLADGAKRFIAELSSTGSPEIVIGGAVSLGSRHDLRCEVVVDHATYPYLDHHRVNGTIVVPVAMVIEWFARAARAYRPALHLAAIRDVKVLRGIKLAHWGDRFVIEATQLSNGRDATLAVELRGVDGVKHYTAVCQLNADRPIAAAPIGDPTDLVPLASIYGDPLFHGCDFQVLVRVEASDDALVAITNDASWPGTFTTDPLRIDAALQAALLWTKHRLGGAGLPTGIERIQLHAAGPTKGAVRIVLGNSTQSGERTTTSIWLVSDRGALLAELSGVDVHVLPRAQTTPHARA